jgi:HlyD family secretion protein
MSTALKRIIYGVAIVFIAGGVVLAVSKIFSRNRTKETTSTAIPLTNTVSRGSITVLVQATGRVVPNEEVEIKCKASGEIIQLPVEVSTVVHKGDLLAQLDPQDEERSVKRAEITLAIAEARLAQTKLALQIAEQELASERKRIETALKTAETSTKEAKAKLERVEQLYAKGMASSEDRDTAITLYTKALADLEEAQVRMQDIKLRELQIESKREDIKIATSQVEADKLLLSDAKQRLSETRVTAPIDGVIIDRYVQKGQIIASGINNVGGGTTLMTLGDLSRIFVLVAVDESDIGKISVGQNARIRVEAYPDITFPGEVVRIAAKGKSISNVVTFEVKVEVKGPRKDLLKPEMTASVDILVADKKDVVLLPVRFLMSRRDRKMVRVRLPDGTEEIRNVETGANDGEKVEIISGIREGETVVIYPDETESKWKRSRTSADDRERMRVRLLSPLIPPPRPVR